MYNTGTLTSLGNEEASRLERAVLSAIKAKYYTRTHGKALDDVDAASSRHRITEAGSSAAHLAGPVMS